MCVCVCVYVCVTCVHETVYDRDFLRPHRLKGAVHMYVLFMVICVCMCVCVCVSHVCIRLCVDVTSCFHTS